VTVPLSVVEAEVGELADLVDSKTHRDLRVPDRLAFRVLAGCFSSRRAKWSDDSATGSHDLPLAGSSLLAGTTA
jgi:hypothetical protein